MDVQDHYAWYDAVLTWDCEHANPSDIEMKWGVFEDLVRDSNAELAYAYLRAFYLV